MFESKAISNISFGRPHLVILGAGASRAAFPSGDRNGKKIPIMNDLIELLNLESPLKQAGIVFEGRNFEDIYASICKKSEWKQLAQEVEQRVFEYFSDLEMPESPTLYDHLVLSLRQKDVIATFNWDPFLFWSLERNHHIAEMPQVVFLHGNVAVGYCLDDKKKGHSGQKCSVCRKPFKPAPLLYPVLKKEYSSEPFISSAWDYLRVSLKNAYVLTIFGYSAPATDVEAIKIMKTAWGKAHDRNLEEVELIDIKTDDELEKTWEPFIHSHHYRTHNNFYDSFIAKHPRRTCEAMWSCLMDLDPYEDVDIPKGACFDELWEWFRPLVEAERKMTESHEKR